MSDLESLTSLAERKSPICLRLAQHSIGMSGMDIEKVLIQLRFEHARISAAIEAIERLTRGRGNSGSPIKRRGRPPGSKNKPKANNSQP